MNIHGYCGTPENEAGEYVGVCKCGHKTKAFKTKGAAQRTLTAHVQQGNAKPKPKRKATTAQKRALARGRATTAQKRALARGRATAARNRTAKRVVLPVLDELAAGTLDSRPRRQVTL